MFCTQHLVYEAGWDAQNISNHGAGAILKRVISVLMLVLPCQFPGVVLQAMHSTVHRGACRHPNHRRKHIRWARPCTAPSTVGPIIQRGGTFLYSGFETCFGWDRVTRHLSLPSSDGSPCISNPGFGGILKKPKNIYRAML